MSSTRPRLALDLHLALSLSTYLNMAAQIATGTSELRDITKMERIGEHLYITSLTSVLVLNAGHRCAFAYPRSWAGRQARTARKLSGNGGTGESAEGCGHDSSHGAGGQDCGASYAFRGSTVHRKDCHCAGCVLLSYIYIYLENMIIKNRIK